MVFIFETGFFLMKPKDIQMSKYVLSRSIDKLMWSKQVRKGSIEQMRPDNGYIKKSR